MNRIFKAIKAWYYKKIKPLTSFLAKKVHPNVITISSIVPGGFTAYFISTGQFLWASIFWFVTCVPDSIDGEVARKSNKKSEMGAFLDSVFDRINDFLFFWGVFIYFTHTTPFDLFIGIISTSHAISLTFGALAFSFLISYIRARSEGLGIECRVGILPRERRFFLMLATLIAASCFPAHEQKCLLIGVSVILVLAIITVGQRIWHSKKQLNLFNS